MLSIRFAFYHVQKKKKRKCILLLHPRWYKTLIQLHISYCVHIHPQYGIIKPPQIANNTSKMRFYGKCTLVFRTPWKKKKKEELYNWILFEWLQWKRRWQWWWWHGSPAMLYEMIAYISTLYVCACAPLFWTIKFWLNTFIYQYHNAEACQQWKQNWA